MTDLVFEDPPPAARGPNRRVKKFSEEAAVLRSRPGEWAIIARFSDSHKAGQLAGNVRIGNYTALRGYEAVARNVDGEYRVYARYVERPGSA